MSFKKVAYDAIALDQGQIVEDSKCCLKVNAVISRAGVYQYEDGKAFKCPKELLKATRTAQYAKLTVGNHPASQIIQSQADIKGGVEKPYFDRDKIRATLSFDKNELPEETINKVRDAINKKTGLDNSIGFYYTPEWTPGIDRNVNTDKEEHYDYIMRDIVIDHVLVVTEPHVQGRCTFPKCGIGADCVKCPRKIGKTFSSLNYPETIRVNDRTYALIQSDDIVQQGDKFCVTHCHGPDVGKVIKCFDSREEAEAFHVSITDSKVQNNGGKTTMSEEKPAKTPKIPTNLDADYPWNQCIADQTGQGYSEEQAQRICAAIKNRTVSHASQFQKLPNLADAANFVLDKAEKDPLFAYNLDKFIAKDTQVLLKPYDKNAEFMKCVAEKMKFGDMTQGQAEAHCLSVTMPFEREHQETAPPGPVTTDAKDESIDAKITDLKELLKIKEQRDIERGREQRRNPVG